MRRHASLHAARGSAAAAACSGKRDSFPFAFHFPSTFRSAFHLDSAFPFPFGFHYRPFRAPAHFYREPQIEHTLQPDIPISGTPFTYIAGSGAGAGRRCRSGRSRRRERGLR